MRRWRGSGRRWPLALLVAAAVPAPSPVQGGPQPDRPLPAERVNAIDHGVVPSATVDNAAALDAAARFAAERDLVLYLPPGVYGYAAGDFDMAPGLELAGAGASVSVLRMIDGGADARMVNFYGDDDVVIRDVGFDGNFGGRTAAFGAPPLEAKLLNISGSHRIRIERCAFRDMTHGIVVGGTGAATSSGVEIIDCSFVLQSAAFTHPSGHALAAFGVLVPAGAASNVTITGCTFTGGADDPAGVAPGSSAISIGGDHCTVSGNTFTGYHHGGGGIPIHLNETSSFVTVTGNEMIRCGGDNLSIRGTDHTVTDNVMFASDDQGIACENAERCTFTANRVDSTRTASIRVLNARACVFRDNVTKDPGSPIEGPAVAAMAHSHYHVRNDQDVPWQVIEDVTIEGAAMTTTNNHTSYGIFLGRYGKADRVVDVLLGDGNALVTSQPTDTLWGGREFPRALRPGSRATGRLRDAPHGRPTIAADPDTVFHWTGDEWEPVTALNIRLGEDAELPRLGAARPNPCGPQTRVDWSMPRDGAVSLTVHDVAGRLVSTLVDGVRAAGMYTAVWEGRDDAGLPAASGTYFLRLRSAGGAASRRVVLLQ